MSKKYLDPKLPISYGLFDCSSVTERLMRILDAAGYKSVGQLFADGYEKSATKGKAASERINTRLYAWSRKVESTLEDFFEEYTIVNQNKNIDWEQRRYELTKDILAALTSKIFQYENIDKAIKLADMTIIKLKENEEYR